MKGRGIMKIVMSFLVITCLTAGVSEASWYVVDADKKVVAKCEYQPDVKDLEPRHENAVFSLEDISLIEAEYRDGRITRYIKTPSEVAEDNKRKERESEDALLEEKLKTMPIE